MGGHRIPPVKKAPTAPARTVAAVVGPHPQPPHYIGSWLSAVDGSTSSGVSHRTLSETLTLGSNLLQALRGAITTHHASATQMSSFKASQMALKRQGLTKVAASMSLFPRNPTTRKGNFAEILLAEYLTAAGGTKLLVHRLRYNPNVEQSMKGDDVLTFDLESTPRRMIVGEAKFRSLATKPVAEEISAALSRSMQRLLPASLQFVVDRLFEVGRSDEGSEVNRFAEYFGKGKLLVDYVGFLVGGNAASIIDKHLPKDPPDLVALSLTLGAPEDTVSSSFEGLE